MNYLLLCFKKITSRDRDVITHAGYVIWGTEISRIQAIVAFWQGSLVENHTLVRMILLGFAICCALAGLWRWESGIYTMVLPIVLHP